MSYFPKHYINPNQYTAGGEFMYASSQIEYKGWYWSTGNGKYYTGKIQVLPLPLLSLINMIHLQASILKFQCHQLWAIWIKTGIWI